jgi:hypothetical protein
VSPGDAVESEGAAGAAAEPSSPHEAGTAAPSAGAWLAAGDRLGLLALGLLALGLRIPGLDRSLWYDELFTLAHFAGSFGEAVGAQVAANNHPPASLLAWIVSGAGAGEVGLRLPFALSGAAAAPALVWSLRRLGAGAAAWVAGALLAAAPDAVLASQQIRGYALMLPLAALLPGLVAGGGAGSARASVGDGGAGRSLIGLVAVAGLGVWSHLTLLAGALALLPAAGWVGRRRLLALGGGVCAGLILWAPVLGRTWKFVRRSAQHDLPTLAPDPLGLTDLVGVAGGGSSALGGALLLLACAGAAALLRARRARLALALGGPLVAAVLVALVGPAGYRRFLWFALPSVCGLAACGLVAVGVGRRVRLAALAGLLALCLGPLTAGARRELMDLRGACDVGLARARALQVPLVGVGPGGELCRAYAPVLLVDPAGEETLAALEAGRGVVCVVPLPRWLEERAPALRARLWGEGMADPVLLPGRESPVLVVAPVSPPPAPPAEEEGR